MGMKINAHLPIPADLKAEYPLSSQILKLKEKRDREIREIFEGKSDKFLVIVGPCSADNEDSVCEYVSRRADLPGQMRCSIPKIEVILTIFCLMRQSEQDLWKISSIV